MNIQMFIQLTWTRFKKYSYKGLGSGSRDIQTFTQRAIDQVQQSFKYQFSRLVSDIINIQIFVQTNTSFIRRSKIHTVDLNHVQTNVGKKRNQTSFSQGIITESEKRQKKKLLIDYLYANLKNHNFWAYRYFFCEFLGILNVVGAFLSFWSNFLYPQCGRCVRNIRRSVSIPSYRLCF